jgi:hypothetical protein
MVLVFFSHPSRTGEFSLSPVLKPVAITCQTKESVMVIKVVFGVYNYGFQGIIFQTFEKNQMITLITIASFMQTIDSLRLSK